MTSNETGMLFTETVDGAVLLVLNEAAVPDVPGRVCECGWSACGWLAPLNRAAVGELLLVPVEPAIVWLGEVTPWVWPGVVCEWVVAPPVVVGAPVPLVPRG